ncbi:MAG: two-component regulator propeller domain-containing protein [Bacteroidota bacterium]
MLQVTRSFIGIILFVLIIIGSVFSQNSGIFFHDFSPFNELSQQPVNCMLQDSKGYFWIGTFSGLYRYDGLELTHFVHKAEDTHSLLNNNVTDLVEDTYGQIWINCESGLSVYIPKEGKFYSWLDENSKDLYKSQRGTVLSVAKSGNEIEEIIPFASQKAELNKRYLIKRQGIEQIPQTFRFKKCVEDHLGRLWIGCNKGLLLFDASGQFKRVKRSANIYSLALSPDQRTLWAGFGRPFIAALSLSNVDGKDWDWSQKISYSKDPRIISSDLLIDHNQIIWIATTSGLFKVHPDKEALETKITHYQADETRVGALSNNRMRCIYQDDHQNIWFCTIQGIKQVREKPFVWEYIKLASEDYTPLHQDINSVYEDKQKRLWVGTTNDGLFCRRNPQEPFVKIPFSQSKCGEITSTQGGDLLVGMEHTVWVLPAQMSLEEAMDLNNWKLISQEKQAVKTILEVNPGILWLGLWRDGISVRSLHDGKLFESPLQEKEDQNPEFHVEVLLKDHREQVWVGTRGYGLYRMSTDGKILQFYDLGAKEGDIAYGVLSLYEDHQGDIWVATRGGSLFHFPAGQNEIRRFSQEDGLPSNTVCGILEDSFNRLWVSTENGLAMMLPEESIPFISFGTNDGLLNSHFNFNAIAQAHDGHLYVGSTNGLYLLRPNKPSEIPQISKMMINQIQVIRREKSDGPFSNTNLNLEQRIHKRTLDLTYEERSFDIHFTTLDFTAPQKVKYAYRLAGHESSWNYITNGQSFARYVDVPSGQYQFELRSSDSHGRWSDQVLSLSIAIEQPIWLQGQAILIYFLLGICLILGIWSLVIRWEDLKLRLKMVSQEKAHQNSNISYFSDISHEIRNRLTMIMGPLENVISSSNGDVALDTLQRIYQNAKRLKRLTDEIMNFRKGEMGAFHLKVGRGDIRQFLNRIKRDMDEVAKIRNVDFELQAEEEEILAWFDQQIIEIIVLNLLSNSFKYTAEHGKVRMEIKTEWLKENQIPNWELQQGEYVCFKVIDNGEGIPEDAIDQIFEPFYQSAISKTTLTEGSGLGLDLVVRLVQLHHGAISAESKHGEKTLVTCWIPRDQEMYQAEELQLMPPTSTKQESFFPVVKQQEKFPNKPMLLIAEDDVELRRMLSKALQSEYRILQAKNGLEGFELAQEYEPDFILSDLIMPEVDGLGFLQKVRAHQSLMDIPFVILTARYSETQKLACIQSQADDFIEKPFRMEFLKWRIRNLLKTREQLRKKYSRIGMAEPKEIQYVSTEDQFIQRVAELMEKHISSSWLSVEFLASEMSMSRATFYRRMEEIMHDSPSNFIKQFRLKRATQLLQQKRFNISEVSHQTGFKNPRYFSKCFQKEYGVSPSVYLKQLGKTEKATAKA